MNAFPWIIVILTFISYLICVVLGIRYLRRLELPFKWLAGFIWVAFFMELLNTYLINLQIKSSASLHVYTIVEFAILFMVFRALYAPLIQPYLALATILGFACFAGIDILYFESLDVFNSYARGLESLILMLLSLVFFFQRLQQPGPTPLLKQPGFWLASGTLIYFGVNLFLFTMNRSLDEKTFANLWGLIHNPVILTRNVFFGVALWIARKRMNPSFS